MFNHVEKKHPENSINVKLKLPIQIEYICEYLSV